MQNIHGPHEWVSVQDMARATQMCIELLTLWSTSHNSSKKWDTDARLAAEADLVDWAG
jgi:hypothetical protein